MQRDILSMYLVSCNKREYLSSSGSEMANYSYISPPPPPAPYPYHSPPPPSPPPPPNCTCVCPAPPPCQYWPPAPASNIAPQPQPPPPPTPGNTTIYIAVFVSLGGVFFLAFLAAGLFCLAKKRPDCPDAVETCVEEREHQHIEKIVTTGPCGEKTVIVTIDDDKQILEIAEACVIEPGGAGPSHASKPHNL